MGSTHLEREDGGTVRMVKKLYNKKDYDRALKVPDKEGDTRDPFRRDLARLIHSPAFRRLQGKM